MGEWPGSAKVLQAAKPSHYGARGRGWCRAFCLAAGSESVLSPFSAWPSSSPRQGVGGLFSEWGCVAGGYFRRTGRTEAYRVAGPDSVPSYRHHHHHCTIWV